jgi:DNA modification methylase
MGVADQGLPGVIHTGDCIEVMAAMDADSVDAIVTDPPYGIGFMGKAWDTMAVDPVEASWAAKGRNTSVKPSSHPTSKATGSGSYGTSAVGFKETNPRCGNCGRVTRGRETAKGFKVCHCETPVLVGTPNRDARRFQEWCRLWGEQAYRVTKPGGYLLAFGGTRTHHRLVCGLEDAGWIIRDELDWIYASGFPKGKANLKPAHEPIVLARKPGPLRPLAIDECRIGTTNDDEGRPNRFVGINAQRVAMNAAEDGSLADGVPMTMQGRWPSNVLLSEPALFDEPNPEVVGSGTTTQSTPFEWAKDRQTEPTIYGGGKGIPFDKEAMEGGYGDSGGYSRFFVIPKADRADREPVVRGQIERQSRSTLNAYAKPSEGRTAPKNGSNPRENAHPTVKPVDLMRHLVRLVTPQGGTVLDPFLGSGSTAIAAELEGFPWIGIEKEESYVAIAEARLNGTQRGLGLDVPAPNAPAKRSTGHWPKERTPGSEGWGFTGQTGLEERYDK